MWTALFILSWLGLFGLAVYFFRKRKISKPRTEAGRIEAPKPWVWEYAGIYRKKEYLFDSASEFSIFKILVELFGDRFHIFPQINLGHLIDTNTREFYDRRKYRSKIEKKSVDFVFCDKQRVVPQLVIELDGYSHGREDRKQRDFFVDQLMAHVGLPILHLKVGSLNKEFIKSEIERALATK